MNWQDYDIMEWYENLNERSNDTVKCQSKEKCVMKNVDKGFEFQYFNLSHRRRLIRTIWITVFGVIIIPVLYLFVRNFSLPLFSSWKSILILDTVLLIIGIIQAVYEYRKWKTEKASTDLNGETK